VDLARPELRFELRSALNRVFEQGASTLSLPILVRFNGAPHRVHILVKPAPESAAESRAALAMFIEGEAVDQSIAAADRQVTDETVRRLTQELELTQSRLRTVREESDAANEELRAANEELQSINEEYRSTSEELETSKEELQSINEELQTVNSELKLKLEAISRAHSDLQNLIAATDFGTLFLDSGLRIKRFTDRVTELFSITVTDEGRPITDFAHQLYYDDLVKDARAVLTELAPVRREVCSRSGRWYDMRIRPYRTVDDKIDGVVITFVDVSDRHQIEEALVSSERQLLQQKHLIDLSRDPIFVWDFDGGIVEWNSGSEQLYGYTRDEAIGKTKEHLLKTVVPGSSFAEMRAKLLGDGSWAGQLHQKNKNGQDLVVESQIVLEDFNGRRLVLESTRDVTAREAAARRLRLLLGELTHRVRNTLAVIQAIARHTMRNSKSMNDFTERFDGRISALALAHSLLVGSEWKGADLAQLARQQLAPYISDTPDRLRLEGQPVSLPADLATPFGLVLHELATNAAKYGSLSVAAGTVMVSWTISMRNNRRFLKLIWKEAGGPRVGKPTATGFGNTLVDSVIPGATVEREFLPAGLVCTIEFELLEAADDAVLAAVR
jgi:two-component system CheB/CheR fusion protein